MLSEVHNISYIFQRWAMPDTHLARNKARLERRKGREKKDTYIFLLAMMENIPFAVRAEYSGR